MNASRRTDALPSALWPAIEAILLMAAGIASTQVHKLAPLALLAAGGAFLVWRHRRDTASVVGIVLAIFCAAPLLRRLVDLRSGFTPSSPILAAPYAPVGVLALMVLLDAPLLRRGHLVPTMFSLIAILLAYCVGVLKLGIFPASIGLLQFLSGPLLLLVVCIRPERFSLERFLGWLGCIAFATAAYGLYQYVALPEWDKYWLIASALIGPAGQPVAYGIRTWSTLNSMAPFSYFMAFALICLVNTRWYPLMAPVCLLALISTMGRSAWGTLVLGWALALFVLPTRDRTRLVRIIAILLATLGTVAIFLPPETLERTKARFETLGNLQNDQSYSSRIMIAESATSMDGVQDPMGMGLGSTGSAARVAESSGMAHLDNGFVALAYSFGWFGTFLFMAGFLAALCFAFTGFGKGPASATILLCASIALFVANVFENTMADYRGLLLWVGVGAPLAVKNMPSASSRAKGILR